MKNNYNPKEIENFVQNYWETNNTFQVIENEKKIKFYCLAMMPYPSGNLHMGHVRNYTISDVISRYQRMLGKNVLQPIGWDAFGLPAEEAAIQHQVSPDKWTKNNIAFMKKQLISLGFSYDWSREINTSKPEYYHWEQWFFIKLYQKNIAYKKTAMVNWCPKDNTVLANEQVDNKKCWRCHTTVIQKEIPQWFLKITDYAEELTNSLDRLTEWPTSVKNMQKKWIGLSKSIEITLNFTNKKQQIKVSTTRLDTLMGATYVAISPLHPFAQKLQKKNTTIKNYIQNSCDHLDYISNPLNFNKRGIHSTNFVLHPLTNHSIPIWIANFVLKEHTTDSIICTPAHNQYEWTFAKYHNIKIKPVILDINNLEPNIDHQPTLNYGILYNSDKFNGFTSEIAYKKIFFQLQNKYNAKKITITKIKDWSISRQRYWGTPIPIAIMKNGEINVIPEKQLPIHLPKIDYANLINKKLISKQLEKWKNIYINNSKAIRETDTFDTFVESSWYYARYTSPQYKKGIVNPKAAQYWLPVDQYIGGIEHAIMHLMYFRFFHKLLRDFNLVPYDEPVKNLLCQGMVLSDAFYYINLKGDKIWVPHALIQIKKNQQGKIINAVHKNGEKIIHAGMIKMSKSKKNGIEPGEIIKKYGADTLRLFIMFAAPVNMSLEWNSDGVIGVYRFLNKLWLLTNNYINYNYIHSDINLDELNYEQKKIYRKIHYTIYKVTDDIDRRKMFNTAIAQIMKLVNDLLKISFSHNQDKNLMYYALVNTIKMLYPFTPHMCFVLWIKLTGTYNIDFTSWPIYDKKLIKPKYDTIILQINGKTRHLITMSRIHISQENILSKALNEPKLKKYLHHKDIKKVIYIKNKLLNLVL
ncbi:MAG: leucine--tRNA ligase [Buchnera aphidicola (Eriosoma harunire)]